MSIIHIIGLGPGDPGQLTNDGIKLLTGEKRIYIRTKVHPVAKFLEKNNIDYLALDNFYETAQTFEEVYNNIVNYLIQSSKKYGEIIYAVPGHPMVGESTVKMLLNYKDKECLNIKVYPATSFIDAALPLLGIDPSEGLKILDGLDFCPQRLDLTIHTIIMQVYSKTVASQVKLKLGQVMSDYDEVVIFSGAGMGTQEHTNTVPLYQMDRYSYNHLTSLYIPPIIIEKKTRFQLHDLVNIVEILRGEGGCPWDREQTHKSLIPHLIEEAYEVVDAIEKEDIYLLEEELGDLIFQVFLHSQIAAEKGDFNINDVVTGIASKMIRRHPHVFSNLNLTTSKDVIKNWDKIKETEKGKSSLATILKNIPKGLPSLLRAEKIQNKAAREGFDWETVEGPIDKAKEEIEELKEVYKKGNSDKIMEELGDLLFTVVNICRFFKISPDKALQATNDKFISRIEYMESRLKEEKKVFNELSLDELDILWEESKKNR